MRLSVRHRTVYRYAEPALRVTQALRLWPAQADGLKVFDWTVEVDGRRLSAVTTDGFSNPVATHTTDGAVDGVCIDVRGLVETSDRQGVVSGTIEHLPSRFFLYDTALTRIDDSIRSLVVELPAASDDIARMHALCNLVRDRLDYLPGQTTAETTAAEALSRGAGVCQDHAHVLSAAARALGYPARYVSGYLSAGVEGGEAASHAWTEILVADIGWIGFDAANRICPNELYVRIASGRDYHDAAPVRGVHQGGQTESLEVSVAITESTLASGRSGSPGGRPARTDQQ